MTHNTRSPEEIERGIERDRAHLTDNIETLQDKLSIDGLIGQVSDQFREHGGEIGQSLSRTVKENPAAVALTGIGLAWMIFGNKSGSERDRDRYESSQRRFSGSRAAVDYPSQGASVSRPDPSFKGGSEGLPSWALADHDDHDDNDGYADQIASAASSARDGFKDKIDQAGRQVRTARDTVKDGVATSKSSLTDKAATAKSHVEDTAEMAKRRAANIRARIAEGTENLSDEARERVIVARENAMAARRKATKAVSHSADQAADLYERQPLVVGALALALGAAVGSAAPRTRKEDELMGAHSDQLMRDAERIFHEEREKATAVVAAAKDEAKTIVKEKRTEINSGAPGDQTAAQAVAKEAEKAGKRIAETAKSKAKNEKLGKVAS